MNGESIQAMDSDVGTRKAQFSDALTGIAFGAALSGFMLSVIGGSMFGEDQTKGIKAMMAGLVEAYEHRLDAVKDDLKRAEIRADELRTEAREAQVTIATLRDEAADMRREIEELKAKKGRGKT